MLTKEHTGQEPQGYTPSIITIKTLPPVKAKNEH